MRGVEEAAEAVQRALLTCVGPGAAEAIALAQARLAWQEVVAGAGLDRGGMVSRLVEVRNGVARVEATDGMLAGELTLRAPALLEATNATMRGRPGATMVLQRLSISVGRMRT